MALSAGVAAEASVTYTCKLSSTQHKAWIPDVLFIGHDAQKSRVVVSDPIVLHFNDAPVEGRVTKNTPQQITFSWDYTAQDARGKRAKMQFLATWNKAAQRMKVTAKPVGYSQSFVGRGSCETDVV